LALCFLPAALLLGTALRLGRELARGFRLAFPLCFGGEARGFLGGALLLFCFRLALTLRLLLPRTLFGCPPLLFFFELAFFVG